jgi:hypothetical protein
MLWLIQMILYKFNITLVTYKKHTLNWVLNERYRCKGVIGSESQEKPG